jgi:hypothetical protein
LDANLQPGISHSRRDKVRPNKLPPHVKPFFKSDEHGKEYPATRIRELLSLAKMSNAISLTPGFSPVTAGKIFPNRFNGFSRADKPLKRLVGRRASLTRLKPGVNQSD